MAVGRAGFVFPQNPLRAARRAARTPDSRPDASESFMTNPHRGDDRGGVWRAGRSELEPGIDSYESPLDTTNATVYHSTRKTSVDSIIRFAVGLLTFAIPLADDN